MSERITEEDLRAVAEPEGITCPECGESFPSAFALGRHRFQKHGVRAAAPASSGRSHRRTRPQRTRPTPGKVSTAEVSVRAEVDKAVGHVVVFGGFLTMVLPHTGLAIAGDEGGNGRLPVASRAAIAGEILYERAKRDARVLEALQRFNQIFEGSAAAKLAVDMAAVVAVDLGVVDPHMELEVGPFREGSAFGPLKPVEMVVGDVVAAVDNLRAQYAPPEEPAPAEVAATNGATPRRSRRATAPVVVDGDVTKT